MSLFWATLLSGLAVGGLGAALVRGGEPVRRNFVSWTRSKPAAIVLFGGSGLWFLYHVANLGQADFGNFKNLLLLLFGGTIVGAFFHVRELLAARGAGMLGLLVSLELLNAAYMQYDEPQRLLLVFLAYVIIVGGILFGAMPWMLRDSLTWLQRQPVRITRAGQILIGYGALLAIVSLTY